MAAKSARLPADESWPENVVAFRLSLLPRHAALLDKWLRAGKCMGLCDASIYPPEQSGGLETECVLVWVRENTDPAYMVAPHGSRWVVTDCIRQRVLARMASFSEALHFIRPVLADPAAA